MKSVLFFLLSLAILICCCKRSNIPSQADRIAVSNDVKAVLAALSDSVRTEGFAGWIPFLDNSKEFTWGLKGSPLSYDSVVARFRIRRPSLRLSAVGWDSVRVEPLDENQATLFAVCNQTSFDESGQPVTWTLDVNANLRKINGSWKFHTCQMSEHAEPHTNQNVAEADTSRLLHQSLDSLVKASLGENYNAGSILDVDDRTRNASYRVYQDMGCIFEDPRRQLEHSYIVTIYDEALDSGSIAVIRDKRIVWHSRPFIHSAVRAPLPGFGDLNNDGTTDILFSTPLDMHGYAEELWIISPDSSGGRLLNELDEEGESTIIGASGTFEFSQPDAKGAKVIKANDLSSDLNRFFVYTWNGSVFVKTKSIKARTRH